ncbi:ATP-binding protein [Shewanella sp. NKUCC01_JLK]|uniref:ATP-binding protein n=1 Tax=Shewanella sp. NKUCC01_JLK TaxID=2842123 RepID=UPI001C5BEE92|nr:ATP-binding protein [Shewanella sp. NKUCC01_JLK]MBW3515835.1 ATP-binding protein [Shewanella sp. NKUCC01_JLK]
MKFKISSGLKNIIGKDLITDDFVAIFELVKNSFDAYADRVDIFFGKDEIYIIDNGKGMSKDDIANKWLFVAYSAKSDNSEDVDLDLDYRNNIRSKRGYYAGNKGVGRFSCDRLGSRLKIQSKTECEDKVNQISLDWDAFEVDQKNRFEDVDVQYEPIDIFELPTGILNFSMLSGTVLKITSLREVDSWDRKKLLRLKSSIAKLIDPFGVKKDFSVFIHAPKETASDKKQLDDIDDDDAGVEGVDKSSPYLGIVNGRVDNLVFDKLAKKTTRIKVSLSENKEYIYSELIDRGEVVYRIKEPLSFCFLSTSNISVELYYMNTIAKSNFTKSMGVPNTQFGSIFLFNNGFRVFPIGEPDDDSFLGLNSRKTQGYSRFLGTRELLGLIEISDKTDIFKEASSRDKGLINTPAAEQLRSLVFDKAIKRLEAYVVNVSWVDKLDAESDNLSRILTDQGKSRVVRVLAKLISGKDVELIEYSEKLIDIISVRNDSFEETIINLQQLSKKSNDDYLQNKIDSALTQFRALKEAEELSRKEAERERFIREKAELQAKIDRDAREAAERNLERTEHNLEIIERAFNEEKKRTLFLTKVTSVDLDTIRNFHHQIGIYSSSINHLLQLNLDKINRGQDFNKESLKQLLETVSFKNQQILTISRIATVADYRLSAEEITDDVVNFSKQYLESVVSQYEPDIDVYWDSDGVEWVMNFMPLELMIVIDNLVHNASKPNTGCTKITFHSHLYEKNRLQIDVYDDGYGFAEHLKVDINRIFDIGVTTTDGSGLGLYHVKQVVNNMGGSIHADLSFKNGAMLTMRFAK